MNASQERPGFFKRAVRLLRALRVLIGQAQNILQRLALLDLASKEHASRLDWLSQNHQANVEWLQKTYPEIVAAIGKKLEHDELQRHSEKLFASMYRELEAIRREGGKPGKWIEESQPSLVADARGVVADDFYLDLERCFRGTREELQKRMEPYLKLLCVQGVPDGVVVDLGCGRGEWLELLQQHQIKASGVDLNPINGATCRQAGLEVVTDCAENYLRHQPENSLAGVSAFQLIEHLPFGTLQELIELIFKALKPGGIVILETPNPENLQVACHTFWIDPTHQRPLPPVLLEFMFQRQGFVQIEILRLNPFEEPAPDMVGQEARLYPLLFGPRDYAIIARKPEGI